MVERYFRKHIQGLKPYSTARDEYSGPPGVFMDANENPFGQGLNRYPDPRQLTLRNALARLKGVNEAAVFVGSGSDEIIDLLIRLFCEPGKDSVLILPPTYGMYEVASAAHDVKVEKILLAPDFQPDVEKILKSEAKLLFLCSPNNPTGNLINPEIVEAILKGFNGIVAIDEAYIDFSVGDTSIGLLDKYHNLIVLQTFSKAFGLAAVRVGLAFAAPAIIAAFDRIKLPYNLGDLSARAALRAIERKDKKAKQVQAIVRYRNALAAQLGRLPCVDKVFPSDANFLLVRFVDARTTFDHLIARGIIVRDRSGQPLLGGCLRISVGTAQENRKLIEALKLL
ncbi:MAG: histidinol-phosphate transaminase [Bacteroidia bacterium]|nr:histidinol-phosphate transaminase [Bacteroidia bacterium]